MHAFIALRHSHLFPGKAAFAGKQQTRTSTDGKKGRRPANVQGLSDLIPDNEHYVMFIYSIFTFYSSLSDSTVVDLLCPCVQLVKELLRDVGCIPRDSNHGANPYKHKAVFTLGTLNTYSHPCIKDKRLRQNGLHAVRAIWI